MTTSKKYWLMKSEPYKYSWQTLLREQKTLWDGVRNFEARNNLRAMKLGDLAFFYHSNEGKEIVGVMRISREAMQDPTTTEDWSVVEVEPVKSLTLPVTLETIKATAALANMSLLRRSRLSVCPVQEDEFQLLLSMGKTTLDSPK